MLNELEPASELTGGMMGQADRGKFDAVQDIMDRAYDYVGMQSSVDTKKLISYMKQISATSSDEYGIQFFKDEDFQKLVDVMVFDEKIIKKSDGNFRALNT